MKNILLVFLGICFIWACGGDGGSNSGDGDGDGAQSSVLTGTLNGQSLEIAITTREATTESDGGIRITILGTAGEDEADFSVDVSGGTEIDIPEPAEDAEETPSVEVSVGGSEVNVNLRLAGILYRATSGSVSFTTYGVNVGDSVVGAFDMGMVSFGEDAGNTVLLSGDFDLTVTAPAADED